MSHHRSFSNPPFIGPGSATNLGKNWANKKNVSKGAVFKMKALIGGALVAKMGGVLEDPRIEAQAAWKKKMVIW